MKITVLVLFAFFLGTFSLNIDDFDEYIIDNDECEMPNMPFGEYINSPFHDMNCTSVEAMTYISVEDNVAFLGIKNEAIHQFYGPNDNIDCCYSYIRTNNWNPSSDRSVSYSQCQFFNSAVMLEEDTVYVKCKQGSKTIYENVHTAVTIKKPIQAKIEELKENLQYKNLKPLSVLILAIDGISRLNFDIVLPKTRSFLMNHDFTEFLAFNKVNGNTSPISLITGVNYEETLRGDCENVSNKDWYRNKTVIWQTYGEAGYATAYAEDWVNLTRKIQGPPLTDYYFNTYMEAASKLGGLQSEIMPYCAGLETQGARLLKLAEDFAITFRDKPSFGIFWMNTFSRNYLKSPSQLDEQMIILFENLKLNGIFEESVIFLLSDHGIREGEIRQTVQGWYEERYPLAFVSIPPWFREKFHRQSKRLTQNSVKLTSTFDMYMTLQDILFISTGDFGSVNAAGCNECKSIFSTIPEIRSCADAGIPMEWCTCIGKLDKNHPDLTNFIKIDAVNFIMNAQIIKKGHKYINIVSTSMTYFQSSSFVLIAFETDSQVHLALLQGTENPIMFEKIIKYMKLRER